MADSVLCSVHPEGSQLLCQLTESEMNKLNEGLEKGDDTFLKWAVENKSLGIIVRKVTDDLPDKPSGSDQLPPQKGRSVWDKTTTKLLLSLVQEDKDTFKNPKVKRKDFWQDTAVKMSAKGKNVPGCDVHKKFNNLFDTYKRIKKKERKAGKRVISTWDYYDDFESICDDDDDDDDNDDDPSITPCDIQVAASAVYDSPSPTPSLRSEASDASTSSEVPPPSPVSTSRRGTKRRLRADNNNEPKKTTLLDELAQGRLQRAETSARLLEIGKNDLAVKKDILALAKEKLELEKQKVQVLREVEEKSASEFSSAIRYLADAILKAK